MKLPGYQNLEGKTVTNDHHNITRLTQTTTHEVTQPIYLSSHGVTSAITTNITTTTITTTESLESTSLVDDASSSKTFSYTSIDTTSASTTETDIGKYTIYIETNERNISEIMLFKVR